MGEQQGGDLTQEHKNRPHIDIDGDKIVEAFTSKHFKTPLQFLAGAQRNSNIRAENGFKVMRHLETDKLKVFYDTDADFHSTGMSSESIERIDEAEENGYFTLIDVHFHPYQEGDAEQALTPSYEDLMALQKASREIENDHGYVGLPIGVVCHVGGDSVDMLLFQQRNPSVVEDSTIEYCSEELNQCITREEVVQSLEGLNYRAMVLEYNRGGFSEQDKEKLKAFGFTMTPITPRQDMYNPDSKNAL